MIRIGIIGMNAVYPVEDPKNFADAKGTFFRTLPCP